MNQVDFEVTGRKKCTLLLTSVHLNFQLLALKSPVHGTHSSHSLASVTQVGQNFQKPSCIANTFLLPVTVAFTRTRISHPEDGGTMFLWNVRIYIYCMVWQHRKGQSNGKIIVMKNRKPILVTLYMNYVFVPALAPNGHCYEFRCVLFISVNILSTYV